MRPFLLLILGVTLASPAALPLAHAARDSDSDGASRSEIKRLIADLGSDEYAVRERAEQRLIRLGADAFDELVAAAGSTDIEIADRIGSITQRVHVPWIRPEDSAVVRSLFTRYAELSEAERSERVSELAALEDLAGVSALCRIARFDRSPLLARRAAAAVLKEMLTDDEQQRFEQTCQAELEGSERPPAQWIRLRLREDDDGAAASTQWFGAIDAELHFLAERSSDTDFDIVQQLVQRQLDQGLARDSTDTITESLVRVIALVADQLEHSKAEEFREGAGSTLLELVRWGVDWREENAEAAGVAWALEWIIKNKRWDALAAIEDKFEHQFREHRKLLYYLAAASTKAGRDERGQELAERAFELTADDDEERVLIASSIAELGQVAWAEREYRRTIEKHAVIDKLSMKARSELAVWMHDREDCQAAADLLGEFCDALAADKDARLRLIGELEEANGVDGREMVREIQARHLFYLSCVDAKRSDFEAQRRHLEEAVAKYDKDPDILIAMFRSPGADDDFRRRTSVRIKGAAKYMQELIDGDPEYAPWYNQWAWLISNTQGDQKKAVRYSLKSLELAPEEPSYLDTLGRCYYAVGDYEKAVASQAKAVELAPHFQVMQRQLALFERALAEQSAH